MTPRKQKTDLLFLLKRSGLYGATYTTTKNSGLNNAVHILARELEREYPIKTEVEICVDANEIDKYLHKYKPNFCIIEALWVTPTKMAELSALHRGVVFIIRIHSKIPFLAQEGNAIGWLKEINKLPNCYISFNNKKTNRDANRVGITDAVYLPNIYKKLSHVPRLRQRILEYNVKTKPRKVLNIGCFGAIRPLKNQLIQAVAAIEFANKNNQHLKFHINSIRVEQGGEGVLKNLRSLFEGSGHKLVEHQWLEPKDFDLLLTTMDISMQVSFTESFNIVTADSVYNGIPVVVGEDIDWISNGSKVYDVNSVSEIICVLNSVYTYQLRNRNSNFVALNAYNKAALRSWTVII